MIRSFGDKATERLWRRERVRSIDPRIHRVALRKLRQLGSAEPIEDLRVPPGNRLEALKGDRAGQRSIRIKDQWRICVVWTAAGPEEVDELDRAEDLAGEGRDWIIRRQGIERLRSCQTEPSWSRASRPVTMTFQLAVGESDHVSCDPALNQDADAAVVTFRSQLCVRAP